MTHETPRATPPSPDNRPLFLEVEAKMLRKISAALDRDDLPHEELCELIDAYSRIARTHVAAERNRIADQRLQERAGNRQSPGRRRPAEYDPSAPYGRDHDGTPNSREDWHRDLSRAVRRIYGIDFDAEAVARRAEAKQRPGRPSIDPREGTPAPSGADHLTAGP